MVRVGFIGLGMGRLHMQGAAAHPDAKIVACCDTNEARRKNKDGVDITEEFKGCAFYTDYKEMIEKETMDAIVIASPDQLHKEMCEYCLHAGLHVLCEKPLALTEEECLAIVAAAEKSDKKFMVGQICRYTPGFMGAKKLIEEGKIGDLTFVESEYAHDYGRMFEKKGDWRNDPLRNGVVGGGCHAIDLLRWIAGEIEEVCALSNRKIHPELPYDETHIAIMKIKGGIIGKVFVSVSCKRNYTMRSVFYGTKGTIITDNTSDKFTLFYTDDEGNLQTESVPVVVNNHNATGEFADFYKAIAQDLPVSTPAIEGCKTVQAALAIVKSANMGGVPIKL